MNALAGKTILIFEDEGIIQFALRRRLLSAGLTVVGQAADGLSAVDLAIARRPDIILMDVRMPHMDGIEAARSILQVYQPFLVFVSAQDERVCLAADQVLRDCPYVDKPLHFPDFMRLLETHADAHPRAA